MYVVCLYELGELLDQNTLQNKLPKYSCSVHFLTAHNYKYCNYRNHLRLLLLCCYEYKVNW